MAATHVFDCDLCVRGWVLRGVAGEDWPVQCPVCTGRAQVSAYRLGRMLEIGKETLLRCREGRSRAATGERILAGLTDLEARQS